MRNLYTYVFDEPRKKTINEARAQVNPERIVGKDAKEKMAQWINFYNNERLHGALLYLTPADYFEGRKESRLAERREKLHTADINRKAYWLQQQHS